MTLPYERTRAVNMAHSFLRDLVDPKATPRVPKAIRQQAMYVLRHYPSELEMGIISSREDLNIREAYQIFGLDRFK